MLSLKTKTKPKNKTTQTKTSAKTKNKTKPTNNYNQTNLQTKCTYSVLTGFFFLVSFLSFFLPLHLAQFAVRKDGFHGVLRRSVLCCGDCSQSRKC